MTGYVIESEEGSFLNRSFGWTAHDDIKDAYVHPPSVVESLRVVVSQWPIKPVKIYPASYSQRNGVKITGQPIAF